jgi:hypothetical protein
MKTETEHDYKGHRITLLARKINDGEWSCSYRILAIENAEAPGFSGTETGTTEDDAKAKALKTAKGSIDRIVR